MNFPQFSFSHEGVVQLVLLRQFYSGRKYCVFSAKPSDGLIIPLMTFRQTRSELLNTPVNKQQQQQQNAPMRI